MPDAAQDIAGCCGMLLGCCLPISMDNGYRTHARCLTNSGPRRGRPLNEQSPFLADCCFLQPITDQYEVMRTAVGNGLPTEPLAGELEEIRLLLPGKPEIAFSPQYAAAPLFDETFQLACRQA